MNEKIEQRGKISQNKLEREGKVMVKPELRQIYRGSLVMDEE